MYPIGQCSQQIQVSAQTGLLHFRKESKTNFLPVFSFSGKNSFDNAQLVERLGNQTS
jgi:hypothetical protein